MAAEEDSVAILAREGLEANQEAGGMAENTRS